MPNKRYYLPVLLFYIITSLIFIVVFGTLFYQHKKEELLDQNAAMLRDHAGIISHAIRRGSPDSRDGFKNYDIAVFDTNTSEFITKEFEPDFRYIKTLKEAKNGLKKPPINLALQEEIKKHGLRARNRELFFTYDKVHTYYYDHRANTLVVLRSGDVAQKLNSLLGMLFLIGTISLVAVCVVAYFIVKMSYKPLLTHIKGLNNFIADTTHEINTPLSIILMSVEMFDKNPNKYLNNIKTASKTLSMLYSDLSANLKITPLCLENVEMGALVRERVSFFEILAQKKNLEFQIDIADFSAKSDKFRLGKIIDNLLSNAIKYSDTGEKIFVSLNEKELKVSQKGVVIPPEKINKIYDKFTRFDVANGGFGIGLSLVKSYCDELKYSISAKSDEKQTTFCVKF